MNETIAGKAARAAAATLAANRRTGCSAGARHAYDYTCPSPETYPFQWAWDSGYHAIALTHLNPRRAQKELSSLLSAVTGTGFLPHMILWQDDLRPKATQEFRIDVWEEWRSVTIAPPVVARAIEHVFKTTGDHAWLRDVLPAALGFFSWLREHRTSPGTGLLEIYQPDESGLDMSPKYDRALGIQDSLPSTVAADWHGAMRTLLDGYSGGRHPESPLRDARTFVWNDVLVNSIYADGLMALSRLAEAAGLPAATSADLARGSEEICRALVRHCWDDDAGAFFDLDLVAGERVPVLTASSLFPVINDFIPDDIAKRIVEEHLLDEREFWHRYPVSSVSATEVTFDPDFSTAAIFRGSSWMNLNWYLHGGLRKRGYHHEARELALRSAECAAAAGMRECYGPHDAGGHGARSFGWSSLVLDLLATEGLPLTDDNGDQLFLED
ncbi:MGH1-like glycoside hydrolase domain-containing protein [Streptomyces sp. NPDC020379]|uniref:MGH1-like glycoside hydrolase domain-containing protein n=1 Tax=Streptomyces sp. NPDC020379 TaxID=3365071 RepID=UPI0037B004B7